MTKPIYMDNNATSPIDPAVLEAMLPYLTGEFGNAASRSHCYGWNADKAVKAARAAIAHSLGAHPMEIVFTGGATESINIALRGVAHALSKRGRHIITTATEHKAVLDTCKHLVEDGFELTVLSTDHHGRVSAESVAAAMREDTILVSVIWANNEVGSLNPIREIGALVEARGAILHADAAQAVGKIPVDVVADNVHLLSASAHKFYGPKGVGFLYCRRARPRVKLTPVIYGGGQELGLRPGTLNVPGVVGMARAIQLATDELPREIERLTSLRRRLHGRLTAALEDVYLNGHPDLRLAGNLNLSFAYVEGEALMMGIPEVAVSSGSACNSAKLEPSHVLRALGVPDDLIHTSVRFGLGRFTSEADVDLVAARVIEEVRRLRRISPLFEMARDGVDLSRVQWRPIGG